MKNIMNLTYKGSLLEVDVGDCGPWEHGQRLISPIFGRATVLGSAVDPYNIRDMRKYLWIQFERDNFSFISSVSDLEVFQRDFKPLTSEDVFESCKGALNNAFQIIHNDPDKKMLSEEQIEELRARLNEIDFLFKSALPQEVGKL